MITAYNDDIQRYIERPSKAAKDGIIAEVKEDLFATGVNYNRLFPAGTKRAGVFDQIVYMLSVGGICKISAERLAKNTEASVRTVKEAVKYVKQTGSFLVGGLADGKNKYVFVYRKHADFAEIIANVFYVDVAQAVAQVAPQSAQQENAESLETEGATGDKSVPIYSNYNIFIQEKDNKPGGNNLSENIHAEKATARTYLTNPYQRRLYMDIRYDLSLHSDLRADSLRIALRAGADLDGESYRKAIAAIRRIDKHLTLGGTVKSIPALFDRLYTDRITYSGYYERKATAAAQRDTSFYYDWVNGEVESAS